MLLTPALMAADESKDDVALTLHRAVIATDEPKPIDAIMSAMLKQTGEEFPPEVQAEMKLRLTEIVLSHEYAEAKAESYAAVFTREELEQLLAMVNNYKTRGRKRLDNELPEAVVGVGNQEQEPFVAACQANRTIWKGRSARHDRVTRTRTAR